MYKLLLVLASAQALKRPQRALAVRGGEIDPITIGKGIVAASGIYGAFDPAANAGLYGIKAEDKGNAMMRLMGWSQILFAAALNLDMDSVHGQRRAGPRRRLDAVFINRQRGRAGSVRVRTPTNRHAIDSLPGVRSYGIFRSTDKWLTTASRSSSSLSRASRSSSARRRPTPSGWRVMAAIGYKTLARVRAPSTNGSEATALWLANGAQFFLAPQSGDRPLRDEGRLQARRVADEPQGRTGALRRHLPRGARSWKSPSPRKAPRTR